MFSSLLLDSNDSLIADRLSRLQDSLRGLDLSTREEYQAATYSLVNRVLNIGDAMQPLRQVRPRPAVCGDMTENLGLLNQDANDIAAELLRIESSTADLFNLAATSQNSLRQTIRKAIYSSNQRRFIEPFIDTTQLLPGYSTTLDYNAGVATLPLNTETQLAPAISVGLASVGTSVTDVSNLCSTTIGTSFQWNGTVLELVLSFDSPVIVNRLKLELDDYDGLEITSLTSSPDGMVFNDLLFDLGVPLILMDATSGKYSGDVILDFAPRYVRQMSIRIECRAGQTSFGLRTLSLFSRTYQASGTVTTVPVYLSTDNVRFSSTEQSLAPYTSVTHQISTDGVTFTTIAPGNLTTSTPFWYRALLGRSETAFSQQQSVVTALVSDASVNQPYTVKSQSTTRLSTGVVEQTLVLANITGEVVFHNAPLANTFRIQSGSIFLTTDDYTLSGTTLNFAANQSLVTITYQASSLGASAFTALKSYYTPFLYEARFEAI